MSDRDTTDAQWHQQEQTEQQYFEYHRHVNDKFQLYCQLQGFTPMPKTSEMIQSKYMRKEDIEEDTIMTIKDCTLEDVGQDQQKEQRWALWFKEFPKAMILNVTTIRVLEQAFGDDTDDWMGKRVKVYVDPNVSFQGRVVGGLRLRPPPKQVKTPVKPTKTDEDEFADEVPF